MSPSWQASGATTSARAWLLPTMTTTGTPTCSWRISAGTFCTGTSGTGPSRTCPRRQAWRAEGGRREPGSSITTGTVTSTSSCPAYVEWSFAENPWCGERKPGHRSYCHPKHFAPIPHLLYRNNGNGTFGDVGEETGLSAVPGKGLGIAFNDYDRDGWIDVLVANDSFPQQLFRNLDGRGFEEVALLSGMAYDENGRTFAGMGADFADYEQRRQPRRVHQRAGTPAVRPLPERRRSVRVRLGSDRRQRDHLDALGMGRQGFSTTTTTG